MKRPAIRAISRAACGALVVALTACGDSRPSDEPPPPRRGAARLESTAAPSKPSARSEIVQPAEAPVEPAQEEPSAPAVNAEAEPEAEKPKERDYAAELLEAIGAPTACLAPRVGGAAPKELSIGLEVQVIELGRVTRAYARSPQLTEDELTCVRKRLEGVRFRAPVESAPRSVSATLRFELKAAAQPDAAIAAPAPTTPASNAPY